MSAAVVALDGLHQSAHQFARIVANGGHVRCREPMRATQLVDAFGGETCHAPHDGRNLLPLVSPFTLQETMDRRVRCQPHGAFGEPPCRCTKCSTNWFDGMECTCIQEP